MATTIQPKEKSREAFPLLATGYHLSAEEFHNRYQQLPEREHAELIEGIVYMASPISRLHSVPHSTINGLCWVYAAETPGVESSGNGTVRLDGKNEYEPDGYVRQVKGQTKEEGDYLAGSPEFVYEISNTTLAMDLHEKFAVYERNGVREYLVWQVQEKKIELFQRTSGTFAKVQADANGILESRALPGLWFDTKAILKADNKGALETLERGLKSSEHADFVKRLQGGLK
jgi:Uma2 family endonuclease